MKPAPVVRIDLDSPIPVFRQIASALRALLVDDAFAPGDRLPTIRELAMELGINPNTVADAYTVLAGEGWIELRRRHGATVLDRQKPRATPESRDTFARRLRELIAEARSAGVTGRSISESLRAAAEGLS